MNLLDFVQQPIDTPEPAPAPAGSRFPITIIWPADAPLAAIVGQWHRLEDGRIETIFYDKEELRTCIDLIQMIRERDLPREQTSMFNITSNNYSEETR